MSIRIGIGKTMIGVGLPYVYFDQGKIDEVFEFLGDIPLITGGRLYNQLTGRTDYLTVGGTAGSYTFQCPQTDAYKNADTDYIWIHTDGTTWRTVTEAELVGNDLQRTPTKFGNTAPNLLQKIGIIKASFVLTAKATNELFKLFALPVLWNGVLNANGQIKSNRTGQKLWEAWPIILDDTNVVAWYRHTDSDLITQDGSNRVALWKDFKGSGNDIAQAVTGQKPIWSASGITFNGLFASPQMLQKGFTLPQPVSIYMVAKIISMRGNGDEILFTGVGGGMHLYRHGASATFYMFGGGGELSTGINIPTGTFNLYVAQFNGASSNLKLDATQGSNINTGNTAPAGFTLGSRSDGGYGINIQVKEVLLRKVIDSSGNKTIIFNYLKSKHGL